MGRWSYHTYSCKNFRRLTIASVYQPCTQQVLENGRVRTLTVTAQHTSLLQQQGRHETPRQAFITDLRQFITDQHTQGNGVLLASDYNEELDIKYDSITKLCSDFHLVDLMYHLTGRDDFATYARGSKHIDYILCDAWVSDASIQGCYEPFQYRLKGDHRTMVVDLDTNLLFGNPTAILMTPAQWEFSSKDAGSNWKYIQARHEYLTQHQFAPRLAQLQEVWDPDLAEQLDRDFQRAASSAAKSVRRKPNAPYVTKLANLRKEKNILEQIISQHRTGIDLSSSIAHQVCDGNAFLVPETIPECKQRCRAAQKEIRKLEKDSVTLRRDEQTRLCREAIQRGDHKTAKAIKYRLAAKQTKQMYQKLHYIRRIQKTGISRLEVPQDPTNFDYKKCTEWITIDTPQEIKSKLRDRNQCHFGQVHGMFPTVPPFSEWIDWGASSHISELIVEGTFHPLEVNSLTRELLRHMKRRASLVQILDTLTTTEWIGKISAWPETTSTSPSGFHLTHSKALVAKHNLTPGSPAYATLEEQWEQLIQWQVDLLNATIKHQYSFHRWQSIVNVMKLKQPGNHKIHRIRIIHLYEHDYNLLLAAIYLPSIVYPFHSGSHQRDQCQYLQKQVKQAILPKCGDNRNTPNAIVYRPSEYGGIEMRSHHIEQGIAKTHSLMTSLRAVGVPTNWLSSPLCGPSY